MQLVTPLTGSPLAASRNGYSVTGISMWWFCRFLTWGLLGFFDSIGLFCYHNRVISTMSAHTSDGSGFILKVEALSCCVTTGILCTSISHACTWLDRLIRLYNGADTSVGK